MVSKPMKSIIQTEKVCYYCGNPIADVHHVRLANCSREKAEEYGLIAYICRKHHRELHHNEVMKRALQQHAQSKLEEKIGHEEYMKIFGKSYL